jgi:tripartite-type tricarboxylate transporter receptor subunit TctC
VSGLGTPSHLVGATFANRAGVNLKPVPYRGTPLALQSLEDKSVPLALARVDELAPQHGSGKIRILAQSGAKRSPLLPDVPTLQEANYDVVVMDWYGMFAPAETPDALVEQLNKAVVSVVQSGEVRERLAKMGLQPTGTTPAQLAQIQKTDAQFWKSAQQAAGLAK